MAQIRELLGGDNSGLAGSNYWDGRAEAGYRNLGWVSNKGILKGVVLSVQIQGTETIIDVGTGSGAVLDVLAENLPLGHVIGLDISQAMLTQRTTPLPNNAELVVGSAYDLPFRSHSVDVVTARQVYHNLGNIDRAVAEAHRVLRPGGRLLVCEYVPHDEEVLSFERPIWAMKEPGRNLWTAEQLRQAIAGVWLGRSVEVSIAVLSQYSNKDWMSRSGLPKETQQAILDSYLVAPVEIAERMRIRQTVGEDTLVDRLFAYVVATK